MAPGRKGSPRSRRAGAVPRPRGPAAQAVRPEARFMAPGRKGSPPAHAATASSREGLWRMKMTPIRAKLITLNASPARNAGA